MFLKGAYAVLYLVDNYDSFVYNIVHTIGYPEERIIIKRNDIVDLKDVENSDVKGVIISPGPMCPQNSGKSKDVIELCSRLGKPVLGICLGHQCIGAVFGCEVNKSNKPVHGKSSEIGLEDSVIFSSLPKKIIAGRYHSLYLPKDGFNFDELEIIATLDDGTIMGLQHRKLPIYGVQFHPESILTKGYGEIIFRNFLNFCGLM